MLNGHPDFTTQRKMDSFTVNMCHWHLPRGYERGRTEAQLGLIPSFLSKFDPAPARDQLHRNYSHGGGWCPFFGFELRTDCLVEQWRLEYPEDPPISVVGYTRLRDEMIIVFRYAWVAIVAADGTYEIARMD
jgi:hypothetical protein